MSPENLGRMSNTAEILAKQFRETMRHTGVSGGGAGGDLDFIVTNNNNHNAHSWRRPWKHFKEEFLNFFLINASSNKKNNTNGYGGAGGDGNDDDDDFGDGIDGVSDSDINSATVNAFASDHAEVNALFPKYRIRLQNNFFVSLLAMNILFNVIVIIVALFERTTTPADDTTADQQKQQQLGIILLNGTSLAVFAMFLMMACIDEHLLRPRFSRTLASFTALSAMIFAEYGQELLQLHQQSYLLQRIRPTIYIIIVNHILLPFPSRKSSVIATVTIIILESFISLRQRLEVCKSTSVIIKLTIADTIFYLYAALFGLYMSRLLEIITKRAFHNHYRYIKSKFNIYQEQERQEQLLNSCFPRHLIEDVRKDLKETICLLDKNGQIIQSPFKKLYVKKYDNVSILYADIVNSMLLTNALSANELVETLDDMFGRFDECAEKNNCLRIKLLGDCYYCVSGLPKYDAQHALNCVRMGLDMIDIINCIRKDKNININMRIGIHSGMVLSGIIGVHKWQFDIWSEDSILASSMEHNGVPGYVHVTKETLDLLPELVLQKFLVEVRQINERVGYLISKKKCCSSAEQITGGGGVNDYNFMASGVKRTSTGPTTNKEKNIHNARRRSSFSIIRVQNLNLFQENSVIKPREGTTKKINSFIDQEVEQMPLSFKSSNFRSIHGIHPLFLTFKNDKIKNRKLSINNNNNNNEDDNGGDGQSTNNRLVLEREFISLKDDFFIFYLSFSFVLCLVIGLVKGAIVPKVDTLVVTVIIFAISLLLILVCIYYTYQHIARNLSSTKRNLIWFAVAGTLLLCSLHDIITFNCDEYAKDWSENKLTNIVDWLDCPYLWSYTNCVIVSMTGVSVFIRINLWLKFVLHIIGSTIFTTLLLNKCSLYQLLIPQQEPAKQWVSNVGFDPIFSHLYYVFMIVSILCIIDRQIEYIFRLAFKLSKRLEEEDQESRIMAEINDILLKNILPNYVLQKYLSNSNSFTNELYSESYQFCAVMFAAIPNYSEFYSENKLNDNGIKCLQLLNEIICDFDQHLSDVRFLRIEKIKTIGSTYMAAAGLQPGRGSNGSTNSSSEDERMHVLTLIRFAIKLMETLKSINRDALQDFKLRIGIAVGPVIAGIVCASKPQYDIWGDTVNVASRMESTGVIGRIQITCETAQILSQVTDYGQEFSFEQRGPIQVKGKGNLITYLVKTKYDFEEKEITYV